ncbi:hypothetical protein BUALT_Bualt05G0007100 [Buddleja alternifolia]|uniref:Protein BIG GRAIN 1-like B n=1 Tax=Buddleja alternifolia TaxID=168488 RepID=A0AAV6XNF3_9LAMI|nr:hypothetical protein BUALT_Bualt05G0007100 [Buddleja alternifolia]
MYCGKHPFKDENNKPRKSHRNTPSFSSTLLDEIYRSIDKNVEKVEDFKVQREKPLTKQGSSRACLVEKWMENEKNGHRRRPSLLQDNDSVFFSSDSSGALSSSDSRRKSDVYCLPSDDDHHKDDLIKSKSRAMKMYTNLKKMKQPISPGGRLTSFIQSLFRHISNNKKSKNHEINNGFRDLKSSSSSTCSSTTTFSRSCLKSREEMRSGIERTVRFRPVSSKVDQDSRKPPLPPKTSVREKNRKIGETKRNVLKGYNKSSMLRRVHNDEDEDEDDDDDGISDTSSDLFELDHLALFGNNRFCEELPVYETTDFDMNRAIASVF